MNLNKNSWHYQFLHKWDAGVLRYGDINLCPYVRSLIGHLIGALVIIPCFVGGFCFLALSPIMLGVMWYITGVWAEGSVLVDMASVILVVYCCAALVGIVALALKGVGVVQESVEDTISYQVAKSWHDKVCPILTVTDE
jgi:hypothetical protein